MQCWFHQQPLQHQAFHIVDEIDRQWFSAHDEIPLKKKLDGFFQDLIWLIRETGYVARTRQPTIADVFAYSEIASLWFVGFDLAQYPEVKVWFDKIGANKPVAQAHEALKNMASGMGKR